jgi:chromosome segregation ATPase
MRAEIQELKSQNQTSTDRIAELNRINEGRLNDVQEKDKTIESLKKSISDASNANTKLKNDLETVQSSIAQTKEIDSRTTRDDDFQNMLTENMRLNDLLLSNGIDPDDLDEE